MDWFARLTGFTECGYDETRRRLEIVDGQLRSRVNDRRFGIGDLELVSLGALRARVARTNAPSGRATFREIPGNARQLHTDPEFAGALFQVASQFNLLEMTGPDVTPEDGVTRYQSDRTQGPACAIAAGAATIYRNYFVQVDGQSGQTRDRQLDGLADMGAALSKALGRSRDALWRMQNGYALCSAAGLSAIADHLDQATAAEIDSLRAALRVGAHRDVEVTDIDGPARPVLSQIFCAALPVAYSNVPCPKWMPFARLVLEAAYEATLLEGMLNVARGKSGIVLLTRVGGGAFGNSPDWIDAAIDRALKIADAYPLDVRLVSINAPPA